MSYPNAVEVCRADLFTRESELRERFPQALVDKVLRVLGIESIPNINEKISAMIEKYRRKTIDIEDVEFEEVDLEFDVLFPDLKQQGNGYDNQTEKD